MAMLDQTEARQHALYNAVAHEYDDVFPRHVAERYLAKGTGLARQLLAPSKRILDDGCGTGQLAEAIATQGYEVFGVDLSPGMIMKARARELAGAFTGVGSALPFAPDSFDLAITVATLHHLETAERVAATVGEMARVVRHGGWGGVL